MAVIRVHNKTTFARAVLAKNALANARLVNEAWQDAGHDGSISDALVSKLRSEMKLTGNLRPGRRPGGGGGALAQSGPGPLVSEAVAPEDNGYSPPAAADADDRAELLTRLEREIDDMIFETRSVGGLPEFEDALRRARRILIRGHGE